MKIVWTDIAAMLRHSILVIRSIEITLLGVIV
jgi:hypothetical protein